MTAPANAQAAPEGVHQAVGPHPGDEPLGNPASRWVAVITSIALLGLAGVLGRDLWFHYYENEDPGASWTGQALDFLGSFVSDVAAVVIAVVLALVGLWLLVVTFKPRPHTHVRVHSPVSIWTRPVDVARKATDAVRRDIGAENVRSKADRKKVTVEIPDDGNIPQLEERVTRSLNNEFKGLATPPAVRVKVKPNPSAQTPAQADHTAATQQSAQLEQTAAQPVEPAAEPVVTETTTTTTTTTTSAPVKEEQR